MKDMNELGSSLEKLLSTLKKNRDNVPLDILKSYYKEPYEALVRQVNETASAFAKKVLTHKLILNPNLSIDEQVAVINRTIADSGLLKQMGTCLSKTYSVKQLRELALELRRQVEDVLWPYIDQETCLLADWTEIEKEPMIYNTLTRKVYIDDKWVDWEINLRGKFLIYIKSKESNQSTERGTDYVHR